MTKSMKAIVTVGRVAEAMDSIAPNNLAQSGDNVGLLVGDRSATCKRILLCVDLTPVVLDEAIAEKCDCVVSYHPPLFRPVTTLLADSSGTEAIIYRAIAHGIAVYSPHTALDAAKGGTNDILAGLCKMSNVEPFEYITTGQRQYKIVTFVPQSHLQTVAQAMFAAGAGRIGDYEQCSYRLQGEGTFFGTAGTHPQLGRKGILERVAETRLEMVTSDACLPAVIEGLRSSHPYEEPAFDVYPLAGEPVAGIGRVGELPPKTTLGSLYNSLAKATQSKVMMMVGAPKTRIRRAAVCVGAAGRLPLEKPRSADCEVIITGEIRHHDALAILGNNKTAIALGHWESERPVLKPLAKRLAAELAAVKVIISRRDTGPFLRLST